MKTGIVFAPTAYTAGIATLARHAETLGFESLWVIDHPVIPAQRQTPFPGGGELPAHYAHLMEPLVALAAAAGATERIRLGTGILLLAERHPLLAAKEIATLDVLSQGRFELGIGAGWLREEGEILGVDWPKRWTQTREYLQAMKTCWSQEIAEFHGTYVDFPPLYCEPKPVQKPHPPVLIAGELDRAAERVAAYGDGWIPRYGRIAPEGIAAARQRIGGAAITLFNCPPERAARQPYADVGVERVLHVLPVSGESEALQRLERWAERLL